MGNHPIDGLMSTAMQNIKEMVDVDTIVGAPVETPDGSVIIPISRVGFGFAAGGSEFGKKGKRGGGNVWRRQRRRRFDFAGGVYGRGTGTD